MRRAHRSGLSRALVTVVGVAALAALFTPRAAGATEQALLGGRRARFHAPPRTPRSFIEFRDASALASLGDPTCPAVSRLRLSTSAERFEQIDLPCANWHATASGYTYSDKQASAGGVRRIILRSDRLIIRLKGPSYAPVTVPIPFAEVTIAVGGNRACGRFDTFEVNSGDRAIAAAGSSPCRPRPNFLLVNLDDTRTDGIDRMPTVLARLAGEGLSFRNSFIAHSVCAPSRASLLTGLHARHHGLLSLTGEAAGPRVLRENGADQQTIAVWLRDGGYETGLFGKYINGYNTSEQNAGPNGTFYVPPGWTRWRGMKSTEHYGGVNGPTYTLVDEHGGLTVYDNHATDEQYSTDLLAVETRSFVADAVSGGRNFFAYYAPYASHSDNPSLTPRPAERHDGMFAFQLPPWRPPNWDEADLSDKTLSMQGLPQTDLFTIAINDVVRELAYETLLAVDEQIALFLEQFEALGIADDTVILFTSDNGVSWGEHRLFNQWKQCPFEECLRVPMIVRYPRFTAPGVHDGAVSNVDVAPTILALSGVSPPASPLDGSSFAAEILGQSAPPREDVLLENYRGTHSDRFNYIGQPVDGDLLRVLHGEARPQPRPAVSFELDDDGVTAPGNVPVAIGANEDATFSNLANAIAAFVPFTDVTLNAQQNLLATVDLTLDHTGVYILIDLDQAGVIDRRYPQPDYFGVRDAANGFTYVEHESGEIELYDLTADPYELENVAANPAYAAERARLAARLQDLVDGD